MGDQYSAYVSPPKYTESGARVSDQQYGGHLSTVNTPSGGGVALLHHSAALRPSARHSLMQNASTGERDSVIGGGSSDDVAVAQHHLFREVQRLDTEVGATVDIMLVAPRSLFLSDKLKSRLARNSCLSAGDVHPDQAVNERSTRHRLLDWGQRVKKLQHRLHFEAPALLKNTFFISAYTGLAESIRQLTEGLRDYQPGHGCFGLCIPRRPYNGCKKLQQAAEQLSQLVRDVTAEIGQNRVKAISSMDVSNQSENVVQHTTDNRSRVTGRDRSETLTEDGQTRAIVGTDVFGRAQLREALPIVEESIAVLPLPTAPVLALAAVPVVSGAPAVPARPSPSARASATVTSVELSYSAGLRDSLY